MGYRHRWMYYMTGLPGWLRFGFSPGWLGRSPTGLPPTAQWLLQSGLLPQFMQYLQTAAPTVVPPAVTPPATGAQTAAPFPTFTKEQEKQLLEQQVKLLEAQLENLRKRLEELSK
ncbi:hypothetical protein DRO47_00755 [Candidatus Bathyarchaeota archaeon]|nr:MAG: hypothetical protein DRO47_00755 [Candidatus Bathyarchaeota archaeon]